MAVLAGRDGHAFTGKANCLFDVQLRMPSASSSRAALDERVERISRDHVK